MTGELEPDVDLRLRAIAKAEEYASAVRAQLAEHDELVVEQVAALAKAMSALQVSPTVDLARLVAVAATALADQLVETDRWRAQLKTWADFLENGR